MLSAKWRPFCLGPNVLTFWCIDQDIPGKLDQNHGIDSINHYPTLSFPVEAYMSMLGSYDSPREQELSRHSIHSMNFYQAQWLEHQRELFSPIYPRSNTISIMSSISSHSSRSSGTIDERLLTPGYIGGSSSSPGLSLPPLLPPKEHKVLNLLMLKPEYWNTWKLLT